MSLFIDKNMSIPSSSSNKLDFKPAKPENVDPVIKDLQEENIRRAEDVMASEPLVDPKKFAEDLKKLTDQTSVDIMFTVNEDSGDTIIKLVDKETKEVIKQIPPEYVVKLRENLKEAMDGGDKPSGSFVNTKV